MSYKEISDMECLNSLAGEIADKIFPDFSDASRRYELQGLLIEFAKEIKRQAIEP